MFVPSYYHIHRVLMGFLVLSQSVAILFCFCSSVVISFLNDRHWYPVCRLGILFVVRGIKDYCSDNLVGIQNDYTLVEGCGAYWFPSGLHSCLSDFLKFFKHRVSQLACCSLVIPFVFWSRSIICLNDWRAFLIFAWRPIVIGFQECSQPVRSPESSFLRYALGKPPRFSFRGSGRGLR